LELALPVLAEHLQLHPVAGLVLADQAAQVLRVPDRLAIRGRHDISTDDHDRVADNDLPRSSLQPGPGGRAPPHDPDHQGSALYGKLQGPGHDRRQRLCLGAQVRIDDVAAGEDVRHHPLRGVDRDGEPDADVPSRRGEDRGVDADDPTFGDQQRAARVAWIEGATEIEDVIQTDAAINPGNPGGTLEWT